MVDNWMNRQDETRDKENIFIQREKRNSTRKNLRSNFTMVVDGAKIEGIGSNLSQTGAYFVTSEEIPVELVIRGDNKERTVQAKIVRIDTISEGSQGVAIRFDTRLLDWDN